MRLSDAFAKGPVARVIVAEVKGSAPREVGAEMWVFAEGQHGTIGGGTLEYEAAEAARKLLAQSGTKATKHALGPDLGQCCGGAVTLITDVLHEAPTEPIRAVPLSDKPATLAVERAKQSLRNGTAQARVLLIDDWFLEKPLEPTRQLWIWGAGHVGRALVHTLHPIPDLAITWIDTAPDRFSDIPEGVTQISAAKPELLMTHAPEDAEHLILTYSHALDLALCDAALRRGLATCGLIGSKTKWARFRSRLRAMGHTDAAISGITCPIGDPTLGKHPQAIAVSVAHGLLSQRGNQRDQQGDARPSRADGPHESLSGRRGK
ncbi:MAG: xanthine dehydrogenase accessory protein XdhC [Pseudomonadota bacterium]